ncbi:heterodisulfide reductase-related iron-sulfur binding cluster [Limibacillus halophilus]|jgi:glycerol-3-phosphate dehydrogenase subunit C
MREGSLDAPVRHPVNWEDPEFTDLDKLNEEMERVFDICHGCRRCFNLCDSFPKLFDLIDESETGELDSVAKEDYKPVVDACTLCDMCFMVSCPYVPPHEFNLDFPHLMLRYRYAERVHGKTKEGLSAELTKTDRNGKLAAMAPGLANWASDTKNGMTRGLLEKVADVHREAALPKFHGKTFTLRAKNEVPEVNQEAPAHGRKAILYATCFVNYNNPDIGVAARQVLAKNGVETEVVYPSCCGMPQLEQGDFPKVAENAKRVSKELLEWVEKGYDVIALVPSCALMLKFEWPLILPENEDVKKLAQATYDITEYVVDIAKKEGVAEGMQPLEGNVALHLACHARAQNMGAKGAEMLRLIPDSKVGVIQRCSGHGGSWGIMKNNFETALKVGKPAMRQAAKPDTTYLASECPLAGDHLVQGIERLDAKDKPKIEQSSHPIQLLAKAYGF